MWGAPQNDGGLSEVCLKLRVRCVGCFAEGHPVITLGCIRRNRTEIDRRVQHMARHIPFECNLCSGKVGRLLSYFEVVEDPGRASQRVQYIPSPS